MHGVLRGLGSQTCTCVWGPCPVLLATSPREGSHVASCRPVKGSLRGSKTTRVPSTDSWGPQPGLAPQCCPLLLWEGRSKEANLQAGEGSCISTICLKERRQSPTKQVTPSGSLGNGVREIWGNPAEPRKSLPDPILTNPPTISCSLAPIPGVPPPQGEGRVTVSPQWALSKGLWGPPNTACWVMLLHTFALDLICIS